MNELSEHNFIKNCQNLRRMILKEIVTVVSQFKKGDFLRVANKNDIVLKIYFFY